MGMTLEEQDRSNIALLREVSQHMYQHHPRSHPRHEFWKTLATWLDDVADRYSSFVIDLDDKRQAVALAMDYIATREERPSGVNR